MHEIENLTTGELVKRIPRKVKKFTKKNDLVITGRVGKSWLTIPRDWFYNDISN